MGSLKNAETPEKQAIHIGAEIPSDTPTPIHPMPDPIATRHAGVTRKQMNGDPPFNTFPRIFTDLDYYTKRVVHSYFHETKQAPAWPKDLGNLAGYIKPPHSPTAPRPGNGRR